MKPVFYKMPKEKPKLCPSHQVKDSTANHTTRLARKDKWDKEDRPAVPMMGEEGRAIRMQEAAEERARIDRLRREHDERMRLERKSSVN